MSSFLPKHAGWAAEIQAGLPPTVRSLHVYGEGDELVTTDRSELLEEVYMRAAAGNRGSTVHHVHPGVREKEMRQPNTNNPAAANPVLLPV